MNTKVLNLLILIAAGLAVLPDLKSADAMTPYPDWINLASGKSVTFSPEPNEADVSDEEDAQQLVDGIYSPSDPIWYDREGKSPVGWVGVTPIEILVDLEKIEPIRGLAMRVAAGKSGVAWPAQMKILVSDDGETFADLGDLLELTPEPPSPEGYNTLWLRTEDLKTHGRFVKVVVSAAESGDGTYFFTDELEIYRGEDAWVGLPYPEPAKVANPESPRPDWVNLASRAEVTLDTEPDDATVADIDDRKQLVDGALSPATPLWADKAAVGWVGGEMTEFTVDLGKDSPIQGVALHMAAGQSGVEWPMNIEVYVSEDGANFSTVTDVMAALTERPPEGEYAATWLVADQLKTHGRFVKFVISPTNLGNGAYIFLDEVEVYRGDAAFLEIPLAGVDAPSEWKADLAAIKWRDGFHSIPEVEQPRHVLLIDGKTETGADQPLHQAEDGPDGVSFTLLGEAGQPRAMSWSAKLAQPVSSENCQFVILAFQAEGIRRTYTEQPLVLLQGVAKEATGNEVSLLDANMPLNDGLTHTLVAKLPEGFTLQQVKVSVVTESDAPRLTLKRLEFVNEIPDVLNTEVSAPAALPPGFQPVDLAARANTNLADWFRRVLSTHKVVVDGVRALDSGSVSVSGAPFAVTDGKNNLVAMPESSPSDEQVEFLGQQVDKRYLDPVSRHDVLSVDVDGKAREVLLLMALFSAPVQPRGGIPKGPIRFDDHESLTVELTYEDGETELSFPYSIADKSCYIANRELGAYAVAADPARRLRKITLHNRHFGPAFALAGLTLNTSAAPMVPALSDFGVPVVTKKNPEPGEKESRISQEGSRLTIANRWYQYDFDLSEGFVLNKVINRWNESTPIQLGRSSGLRVRVGNTIYTGRCFRSEVVGTTDTEAKLKLTSLRPELPLEILVTMRVTDTQELVFESESRNIGDQKLEPGISLPFLEGLAVGNLAETGIFFPQYRNVETAESIALQAPYGAEYACQFMDVYSQQAGMGLMVRSDNPEQRMANFAMKKDVSGVAAGIHFPGDYNALAPGESRSYPKISLLAHSGDWHEAFDLYKSWVQTWYRPHRSQDKDFFLNAWDLMCYRTSDKVSWADSRVPSVINPERNRWLMDESFAFEKERLGHVPDLTHFFNWTHNDKTGQNEYGVFGTPLAYEQVGGLDFFRKGIAEIQEKWNSPVSLYTLHDRLRMSSVPDQELVRELAEDAHYKVIDTHISSAVRASGAVDGIIYPQPGNERWINFFVNDLVKMQKDTGCKLVYIDVFPYFAHLRGRNGLSPLEVSFMELKRIREALPADVALWTEYPFTDVASQYADGCLQYYFMEVSEVFARRYNVPDSRPDLLTEMPLNIQRFSTPAYRTIGLPGYIEVGSKPSQPDAVFFNGEAFQEDTYRLHHSRIRERINRSYQVKRKYTDCFNSSDPEPRIDTQARGVVANLFPGKQRNLWTLFNGRPRTYSGVVLEVPHIEGATYRDVWNDQELHPVIENGIAKISVRIDPQHLGCVVQELAGDHSVSTTAPPAQDLKSVPTTGI